ncbi:MAG: ABC transporter ATP-binding protein [Rhizobiaceae bacterium]
MVHVRVNNLAVNYRIRRKLTLQRGARVPAVSGGKIIGSGRIQRVLALNGISFTLNPGDRLGLVGSNGSGKTTLLRALYGVLEPSEGTIDIEGRVDALFNINLGFRREATGRRNIVLRGLINGIGGEQIEERMDEIIEFSELGDFIDMPLKSYSQGMAARLAFSVATCLDPEILLMDEWIGAGDTQFQKKARERMGALANSAGIIVLASHNHQLLQRTCTHILELEHGELVSYTKSSEYFREKDEAS